MRTPSEMADVEESFTIGSAMISALYGREIKRVYEDYSSEHISEILPIKWENRAKSELEAGSARVTVEISCNHCGEQFYPHSEGWKRCPNCDTPHDWLERNT
jgi:rubrerythrin